MQRGGIEDRLDDAIHVLRNHAEAGFPSSTASAIPGDPQISAFHSSYAPPPNPMSDAMLNGCTVTVNFFYDVKCEIFPNNTEIAVIGISPVQKQ